MKWRIFLVIVSALLALGAVNVMAYQREDLAANGRVVFLALAPVDPRSLIQGDYMRLRYALARNVLSNAGTSDGLLVVRLDKQRIAREVRLYDPQKPLARNQVLLAYHQRAHDIHIGPEAFFFQEGHASYFVNARYAELRVSASGDVALVGLRGKDLELLGSP
jgi:uncharacterized membrane-anchored protein